MSIDVPSHNNSRRAGPTPQTQRAPSTEPGAGAQPTDPERESVPEPDLANEREPAPDQDADQPRRITRTALVGLAVMLVVLGAASAAVGALLWPPTFAARAEILYPITQESPTGFLRDDRNLTTQVVLLTSQTVLGPVAAERRMPLEDVERAVSVEVVPGSEVIEIEARDRSPEVALRLVSAVLDRYTVVERMAAPSDARTYLQTQLDAVRGELAGRPTGPAGANDSEAQALLAREQQLLSQLDESTVIDISGPRSQVLAPPYPVERAVAPRVDLAAAAGALAGALVAAAAVGYLLRRRRP